MKKIWEGSNIKDVKQQNRLLALRLIAVGSANTRADLARATGLSKMAVGNIVAELMTQNLVEEQEAGVGSEAAASHGRPPILLKISNKSPFICGMLVKRGFCQVIFSDLSGRIIDCLTTGYDRERMCQAYLLETLAASFQMLASRHPGTVLAVGISSIGPLNAVTGELLNPHDFYGIANVKIVDMVSVRTGLPCFLINDANGGALAEKLYGVAKSFTNFAYLHIMNGIGAGLVLGGSLYSGNFGQSGEIGHTSISYCGPKCSCGNTGCLDLYANLTNMQTKCQALAPLYSASPLCKIECPQWADFVDFAARGDALATTVLGEFCDYISYALIDMLNLLDVTKVIVGYDSVGEGGIIEAILACKISSSVLYSKYREVAFIHAGFGGEAPLVGAIALVANKIFNQELPV